MFFLIGGKRALKIADTCDTHEVISRHKEGIENNDYILQDLKKQLFSKREKSRMMYYILLTDGYFPNSNTTKDDVYFPGHVFILEKIWDEQHQQHYFYFYQSYINQYTLKEHIEKNKGLFVSKTRAQHLVNNLEYVLKAKTWDTNSIEKWLDLTFAETLHFENSQSKQKFFLCFRKAKTSKCLSNIEEYLLKKLKEVSKIKASNENDIYGDTSLYLDKSLALTNKQIKDEIQQLLNKVVLSKTQLGCDG
jgi:hypothetical protein